MLKYIGIPTLLFILSFQLGIAQDSILNIPVNVKLSNTSVNKALDILSKKTDCYFSYDSEIVNSKKIISLNEKNTPLKDILKQIFPNEVSFSVLKNHIIISRKPAVSTENPDKEVDSTIQIRGKIIDGKTKNPIGFALLGILNTNRGTVSNQNGEFTLKIPNTFSDSTVYFINLGYKNVLIPVKDMLNDKILTISLIQEYIPIEEVIIRNTDPKQIVLKAIQNKKLNYFQKPVLITAFYRETVKKSKTLLSYSETFSKIYNTPYKSTIHSDQIKILKSRKIINTGINDTVSIKLKDGLYSSLDLDFVKNTIGFFDETGMSDYNYQLTDIITYNNETVYVISFEQKKFVKVPLYKGKLYINKRNFAVAAAEFQYNLKFRYKNINFVVKKNRKYKISPVSVIYSVNYKKTEGKYILNHVKADLIFKFKKKHNPFSTKFYISFETIGLNYKTENILPFNKKEILKRNRIFINNNYTYDPLFWGRKNYISPEKSVTETLKEIQVKINALQ